VRQISANVDVGFNMNNSERCLRRSLGVIERYCEYLPVTNRTPIVSLHEGATPLIFSRRLSELAGRGHKVFLKYEGLNPTGSFKDRGGDDHGC
jgi:threonine synthase